MIPRLPRSGPTTPQGLALLALAVPGCLTGADQGLSDQVMISWDNDIVVHHDDDYTNGASIGWFSAPEKEWREGFAWAGDLVTTVPFLHVEGALRAVSLDVAQAMYTPTDLTLDPPDPADRPYCGVLLATLGLHQLDDRHLTSIDLSVGAVGPWSGAEATQNLVHKITGSEEAQGWDSQIDNGILVNLAIERRWRILELGSPYHGFGIDSTAGAVGMLGNFRTSAIADAGVRLGYRMNSSYGTLSIRPGSEGRLIPTERASLWGFHLGLMGAGEAVAHDVSLDGRLFHDDAVSVDKEPLIGRFAVVLGGHYARLHLYVLLTYATPNFEQEERQSSSYGRLIAVWSL